MKNFVQPGNVVTLPAPGPGGCKSGDVVSVGSLIGVAATGAAAGKPVEVALTGAFELPLAAAGIAQGAAAYWSGTEVTDDDLDTPLGVAVETAGVAATTARVRLTPSMPVVPADRPVNFRVRR